MQKKVYSDKELKERFCKWSNVELKLELEDIDKLISKNKVTEEKLVWKDMAMQEVKRRKTSGQNDKRRMF